jgi:hypothetical protein
MSDTDETIGELPVPLPGADSKDETAEEQTWPQMDEGSPTLSTDTDPGERPGGPS